MTRTASVILSLAAICLTATAAQAAAPCDGSINGHRYSDGVSRSTQPDDGSINGHHLIDDRTAQNDESASDTVRRTRD